METKVIAIYNCKGGVGKTTSTKALGERLAMLGRKVLLIDADPQCSLSQSFGVEEDPIYSIEDALLDPKKQIRFYKTRTEGLKILPSVITMALVDMEISGKMQRELLFKKFVDRFKDKYDYILVDCPPYYGILVTNVLMACNSLVVPVTLDNLSFKGLEMLEVILKAIRDQKEVEIDKILVTRYNASVKNQTGLLDSIRARHRGRVMESSIRQNVDLDKAMSARASIFEYAPESHAAEDYARAADELVAYFEGAGKPENNDNDNKK